MLVPQSLDTQWYLDVKRSANQTVLIVGGRVAFMEPDTIWDWLKSERTLAAACCSSSVGSVALLDTRRQRSTSA
jgi:hypothetical protein